MYSAYLQYSGFRVAEATNGYEAVQQAQDLQPDIILMDLALPKLDGWEATQAAQEGRAHAGHSGGGADRARARGARRRRPRRRMRRVRDQTLSARRAGGGNPAYAQAFSNALTMAKAARSEVEATDERPRQRVRSSASASPGLRPRRRRRAASWNASGCRRRRAPKPRAAMAHRHLTRRTRARYVYCIIKSERPLSFGASGNRNRPCDGADGSLP